MIGGSAFPSEQTGQPAAPAIGTPADLSGIEGGGIIARNRDGSALSRIRLTSGDTAPARRVQITGGDGEPLDLSGCVAVYLLSQIGVSGLTAGFPAAPVVPKVVTGAAVIESAVAGFLRRDWSPPDTSVPGTYQEVWHLTDASGLTATTTTGAVIVQIL